MYNNYKLNRQVIIALLVVMGFSLTAGAEVKLPEMEREAKAMSAESLGTNENDLGLKAGSTVPDFTINTFEGKPTALEDLLEGSSLLVVFYRGGWCPYCNFQIRQLSQNYSEFEKRNVTPVLISVDKPDASALVKNAYDIPFPVLSDPELAAHEAFDVVLALDDKTVELYKGYGLDLKEWSGKEHNKIAIASAFLVDQKGTVKWANVSTDYKSRPSPRQLLDAIDKNL